MMGRPKKKIPAKAQTKRSGPTIVIEGMSNAITRVKTGLYSFDAAIGGGIPLRTATELFGFTHVGKSTLAYYLLFAASRTLGNFVGILDTEGCDEQYVLGNANRVGFEGTIWFVEMSGAKGTPLDDGDRMDLLRERFREVPGFSGMLLDSVGNVTLPSNLEGSVKEAKMGQRAKVMNDFMRAIIYDLRYKEQPAIYFQTNHSHPILNGQGTTTTGGVGSAFGCAQRIRLSASKRNEDGSIIVEGLMEKLRFRPDTVGHRMPFQVFMLPGFGVHAGLTAVNDCVNLGLATQERTVSMRGKSYGFMSKLVERKDDPEVFQPFLNALEEHYYG